MAFFFRRPQKVYKLKFLVVFKTFICHLVFVHARVLRSAKAKTRKTLRRPSSGPNPSFCIMKVLELDKVQSQGQNVGFITPQATVLPL